MLKTEKDYYIKICISFCSATHGLTPPSATPFLQEQGCWLLGSLALFAFIGATRFVTGEWVGVTKE